MEMYLLTVLEIDIQDQAVGRYGCSHLRLLSSVCRKMPACFLPTFVLFHMVCKTLIKTMHVLIKVEREECIDPC